MQIALSESNEIITHSWIGHADWKRPR